MSQDRSSQDRSSQDMLSQDRSSQVSLSQDRLSQNRSSKDRSSQDRSGQVHLRMEFDSGVGPTCLFDFPSGFTQPSDILGQQFHFLYPAGPVLHDTAHNLVATSPVHRTARDKTG